MISDLLTHETMECDFGLSAVLCTCTRCLREMWRSDVEMFHSQELHSDDPKEYKAYRISMLRRMVVCRIVCVRVCAHVSEN